MVKINVKILFMFVVGFGLGLILDIIGFYRIPSIRLTNAVSRADIKADTNRLQELMDQLRKLQIDNKTQKRILQVSNGDGDVSNYSLSLGTDYTSAEQLYKKVRILCMVLTSPQTLDSRTIYIKNTWGKRCNKAIYVSSKADASFPTIGVEVAEGREHLTQKVLRGLRIAYENYFTDEFDWLFLGDDDTFAIMENMRYFLRDKDTSKPIYYGHYFKVIVSGGFFSGGAGIVMGRESLNRLFTKNLTSCFKRDGDGGDWQLGMCLHDVGVIVGNSTDIHGNSRFHCFTPDTHVGKGYPDWYYKYDANNATGGIDKMSDYAITFHYVSGPRMLELEYYIYHLQPFGMFREDKNLNQPLEKNITTKR